MSVVKLLPTTVLDNANNLRREPVDASDRRHGAERRATRLKRTEVDSARIDPAIPTPGWWHIVKEVFADVGRKNLSIIAAGVAFYGMLSIFPALAVVVSVYGLVADPAVVQHQISAIQGVLPDEARKLILDQLQAFVTAPRSELGLGLIVGLAVALWGIRSGVITLITALNIAYEEEEKRSLLEGNFVGIDSHRELV
jgi:membrane protein